MLGVALDGDGDGDFGGYGLDGNSDVGHSCAVGQRNRLVANRILVVAVDGNVTQGHGAGGAVRPGGRQLDAVQVQLLTQIVLGLVAAADRQLIADGLGTAADLLAELVRVLTQRIIGTVVIRSPCTALYSRAVLGGALRAEHDGAVHLRGVGIAGIQVLHKADALVRAAACGVGVGGDIVVPVQAVPVADDGTDILVAADLAGKAVGADGADHIIPGLGHKAVAAEDAADTLVASNNPVYSACYNSGASTVRGSLVVIAATYNAACIGSTSFYNAMKRRITDNALSHSIISAAKDTSHIASTLHGSRTGTILNCTVNSASKGTNLTFLPIIANRYTGFNHTVANRHNETSTSTRKPIAPCRCNQTRLQRLRALQQSDILDYNRISIQASTRIVIYQSCSFNLLTVNAKIPYCCTIHISEQGQTADWDCNNSISVCINLSVYSARKSS